MAELIVGQAVSLSGQAADKLIALGEGDAALLCLALLRHGDRERARSSLRWSAPRTEAAWAALARLDLVADSSVSVPSPAPSEPESPPDYLRADIHKALDEEPSFQDVYLAAERRLGKKLSDADLKSLYEIYDFLALPAEVILLLITRCVEEFQEKYGPGRLPRMSLIKKTAYVWQRQGIDTVEAAENYLREQTRLHAKERELLFLLDITGRPPVEREREYLAAWVSMGFPNEAVRLAYERTVLKKQSLNWPYMNSILKNWHQKGLHTVEEILSGDSDPARRSPISAAAPVRQTEDRLRRDMEWLERFASENEGG